MKSFALHLIVVFIVGSQYHHHQIGTFCSSMTPKSPLAHDDHRLNLNASTRSSIQDAHLQHQQTTKTSRTIQRLVAGHLQNPRVRKLQVESTTLLNTQLSKTYFRRKPSPPSPPPTTTSSTYYHHSGNHSTILRKIEPNIDDTEEWDSDAALLEDIQDDDNNNWDNGILRSSAGAGKESHTKGKKKDDSKKTLADQVKEGKYGLIEKELFHNEPKRPGIISYLDNKEVPSDTIENLGGLHEDDIWLAEDHLLVLKGGSLNDDDINEPWEPIDDYQAPNRQIKIPANPKIPPPFPVQFEDNGPIQFIGNNKFPVINTLSNKSLSIFTENGYRTPETYGDNEKNLFTRTGSFKNVTNSKGGYFYSAPSSPWLIDNETFINPFLNYSPSPPSPGGEPNGSFDDNNNTDYIDEDDPSLYYPPPYSFVYNSNYSSPVPPGPLVPGIVLPPPPNAFARLEEPTSKTPSKEIPFRQVLTKITEYTPKTIVITTSTTTSTTTTTTESPPITTPPRGIYYTVTRPSKPNRTRVYTTSKKTTTNVPSKLLYPQDIINIIPSNIQSPSSPQHHVNNYGSKVSSLSQIPQPPPPPPQLPSSPSLQPVVNFIPKVSYSRPQQPDYVNFIPDISSPPPQSPETINFVSKPQDGTDNNLSKGNPIYYEYFDARQIPRDPNYYTEYTTPSTTSSTIPATRVPHKKIQFTTQPTHQPVQQPRLSKNYLPQRVPYKYDDYLYITPKPEIRPNGISKNYIPVIVKPSYKPIQHFEQEVDAIRQTLQFYKDQQIQQNYIPRAPKAKAVYEYSFDATRTNHDFIPPLQYDNEPFKPMVQYSRPINDLNGFRAIAYAKSDDLSNQYSTTSPPPSSSSSSSSSVVQQRTRAGGKSYSQTIPYKNTTPRSQDYTLKDQRNYVQRPLLQDIQQYTTTPRTTVVKTQQPWVSIEKQIVQEVEPQINRPPSLHRLRTSLSSNSRNGESSRNQFNNGYYYNPPIITNNRQNDRYYQLTNEELPLPQPQRLSAIKVDVNNQYQHQQLPISLINDTYVNYAPNRPPINPDAEFIRPSFSGQQRLPQNRGQIQHPISLNRDTLVNYRLPLPPINPNSEYIQTQVTNRNTPIYNRPTQYRIPSDQSVGNYYFSPRDVRFRKN